MWYAIQCGPDMPFNVALVKIGTNFWLSKQFRLDTAGLKGTCSQTN